MGESACYLRTLHIKWLILFEPYFRVEDGTESEVRLKEDNITPLPAGDLLWKGEEDCGGATRRR